MEYMVKWEIEVTADSPQEAAQIAGEIQLDPTSLATVFEVMDEDGTIHTIDIMDLE